MGCKNHPDVVAMDRCAGCAEVFCPNCLVEIGGRKYCGSCKVMVLDGRPVATTATKPCKEADEALKFLLIGIFFLGIVLGPVAIVKALKAKSLINASSALSGSGKANAAVIVGVVVTIMGIIGFFARFS